MRAGSWSVKGKKLARQQNKRGKKNTEKNSGVRKKGEGNAENGDWGGLELGFHLARKCRKTKGDREAAQW